MIKDIMVHLDGTVADDLRITAVENLAGIFEAHVTGLFLNILPDISMPIEGGYAAAQVFTDLHQRARDAGDRTEAVLARNLARLDRPVEIKRFDIFATQTGDVASREARSADVFVGLRPGSAGLSKDPGQLVEGVLFGSGRHLVLVPGPTPRRSLDGVLIAWNESREAARAVAEAMPYLRKARNVTVVVVDHEALNDLKPQPGGDIVLHLRHHGIEAVLEYPKSEDGGVSEILIQEARRRQTDLIVLGGYGHSRLREWLLGGVTYDLLQNSPVPLLVAH